MRNLRPVRVRVLSICFYSPVPSLAGGHPSPSTRHISKSVHADSSGSAKVQASTGAGWWRPSPSTRFGQKKKKINHFFLDQEATCPLSLYFSFLPYCCCCWVARLCPAFCALMGCSMPGSPVPHYPLEFAQIHVHWVSNAIWLNGHLIICCPLLLLASIFPSLRIFSNGSALVIRWPKFFEEGNKLGPLA